jgi:hypothetical protein
MRLSHDWADSPFFVMLLIDLHGLYHVVDRIRQDVWFDRGGGSVRRSGSGSVRAHRVRFRFHVEFGFAFGAGMLVFNVVSLDSRLLDVLSSVVLGAAMASAIGALYARGAVQGSADPLP